MSHGLQIAGNYTWSHAIDSGSGWAAERRRRPLRRETPRSTDFTLPGLDRGNSTFDIRHRLTFNYVWELPFFRKSRGWPGRFWVDGNGTESGRFRAAHTGRPSEGASPLAADVEGPDACEPGSFNPAHCFNVGDRLQPGWNRK